MTFKSGAWVALSLIAALMFSQPTSTRAQGGSDLSPSQQARMEAGRTKFQKELAALQADKSLSQAKKQERYLEMSRTADKDMLAILTPAQRALVLEQRDINKQFQKDVAALRVNSKLTDAQKQAEFETLVHNRQKSLLASLPPAQRTRVEKEHQAQLAHVAEANKIGEELQKSLSKQAQQKIQQITVEARTKMQAIATDAALSRPEKAARIQALGHEAEMQIDTLLTPKQRAEFSHYHQLISPGSAQ